MIYDSEFVLTSGVVDPLACEGNNVYGKND